MTIAEEVAATIEDKKPKIPLEAASEKISITQLQSTNSNLSGHEMKQNVSQQECQCRTSKFNYSR